MMSINVCNLAKVVLWSGLNVVFGSVLLAGLPASLL